MSKTKIIKYISIISCFALTFSSYADLKLSKDDYFNNLDPQKHINKMYTDEEKAHLKEKVIAYDDIEDMIHLYNPEILNTWNKWENNKSANDIYSDYQDAADSLSATSGSSDVADAMAAAQADAMRILADQNADDSYTNFLTNYLTEKQLVLSSKILDINYHKSEVDLNIANENLEEAKRAVDKAVNAYGVGQGTELELLTAKKALADAESAVITATSNRNTYKRNLIINCGKSMNDDIEIKPVDLELYFDITTTNLNDDYNTAMANNIQFAVYKRKKENAQTDEVKNQYKISIDAAPQKIFNDLESKHSAILDAMESYSNKSIALRLANDELSKAKNELANGNISQKDYATSEHNVKLAELNLLSTRYDLKIAVENYKYAVAGFSSC